MTACCKLLPLVSSPPSQTPPFPLCSLSISSAAKDEYVVESGPKGFFPSPVPMAPGDEEESPELSKLRRGGFIPNSVLAHLLFPPKPCTSAKEEAKVWRLPTLTEEQLQSIASRQKVSAPSLDDPNLVPVADTLALFDGLHCHKALFP